MMSVISFPLPNPNDDSNIGLCNKVLCWANIFPYIRSTKNPCFWHPHRYDYQHKFHYHLYFHHRHYHLQLHICTDITIYHLFFYFVDFASLCYKFKSCFRSHHISFARIKFQHFTRSKRSTIVVYFRFWFAISPAPVLYYLFFAGRDVCLRTQSNRNCGATILRVCLHPLVFSKTV